MNDGNHPDSAGTTPAPLGRRARKALAARQRLFEAGLEAFERQPIGLVSILDITEGADVAKGVFYLHFRSKDEYLLALWEEVKRILLDHVRAATTQARSRTGRIEATVDQFFSFAEESPGPVRYWMRFSGFLPDDVGEPGHLTRLYQEYIRSLAALVAGCTEDRVSPDDGQTALLLDSICWGLIGALINSSELKCTQDDARRIVLAALRVMSHHRQR